MQKPREFRRIVFDFADAAEALAGPGSDARKIEITQAPRHVLMVEDPESGKKYFDEPQMIEALSIACHQFQIPVPRNADKRILVDRPVRHIILQISIDMMF